MNPSNRKRKRDGVDHYLQAYENVEFESILPEPQQINIPGRLNAIHSKHHPGSPLRQFAHSFRVKLLNLNTEENDHMNMKMYQIIHQHANGLCIVTAGSDLIMSIQQQASQSNSNSNSDRENGNENGTGNAMSCIQSIDFLVSAADPCSAGERRKRQAKMLKKGKLSNNCNNNNKDTDNQQSESAAGVVTPSTVIAKIKLQDGTIIPIYSMVWGTVMEINSNLRVTPQKLTQDPLMDGYLAVILPTGPFPPLPRKSTSTARNGTVDTSATCTDSSAKLNAGADPIDGNTANNSMVY